MDEKKIFGGLAALAGVMLLVAILSPRDEGPDVSELIAQEVAPLSEAVSELGSRVSDFEGSLGEFSDQLANAVTAEDVEEVSARVDEALAQTGALSGSIEEMKTALDDTVQAATTAPAPVPAPEVSQESTSAEATQPEAESEGAGFKPGQTALFADGALRLFVSRLDADAQEVRVSIMGEMKTLAVGQGRTMAVGDDYCRVTVSTVTDQGAEFDTICGDDLPAPEGISVGNTAVLSDGALRVFASLVLEDEARLSINGDMQMVALGQSVPAMAGEDPCRVYLDALDRGHAVVSAKCGAGMAVSDGTGAGSTVLLNEGAVRVFVGSVRDGTVRFAVNGQTLVSGVSGDSVDLGNGCAVMVEEVADRDARFSHVCDG